MKNKNKIGTNITKWLSVLLVVYITIMAKITVNQNIGTLTGTCITKIIKQV